ncbi:MAG TPA: bifunctional UDP-N-acetylmuramoyl-tripeptide:D-alanyl-D-alanine ligase/alanine racemase [Draconibacterium sp.]|nr:bifunctional UDP-N-acetylmuramoyl-tripeptide:D-alanyl-D-alanine ligase/alanine racemase [Draconibacterium sp.]
MIDFTLSEIAEVLNAKLFQGTNYSNQKITQIITDSRTYFKGENSLFFALTGPRNNGHSYIPNLIEKGITAFVVSDSSVLNKKATFILVENTNVALQKLAAFKRQQHNYPVIGITGSNGKTIVKEWLHSILSDEFKIVRSPKSYNSQVGVPLSVLLMDSGYDLGIFEAGISQPGEMINLAEIIKPTIGIFTNIGDAHQEGFASLQQKTEEKLLLFATCKKLIFNADSEIIKNYTENFCSIHSIEKTDWSLKDKNAAISYSAIKIGDFTEITAKVQNRKYNFKIPFTDDSAIENACHCFAAASVLSNDLSALLPEFENLYPVEMRLEIKQGINNCLLVNDYYNSDLNSLSIALSVLHQQAAKAHLSKMVILSDIQQTGLPKAELYSQVNKLLSDWKMDEIIGIGTEISCFSDLFSMRKSFFDSLADFEKQFNRTNFQASAILIKGARQFTFEKISQLLQYQAHQTQLEIDLNALTYNLNVFKKLLRSETKIMVMVKAFSYGSGDVEIASLLQYQNVDYLAVAVTDEGVLLRNAGIQTPIIVMNPEQNSFQQIIDYQLEPNIYSIELMESFIKTVLQIGITEFPVHLKVDTGMNRLGLKTDAEIKQVIKMILESEHIKVQSVFSHLAASDDSSFDAFTLEQIARFEEVSDLISKSFTYKIDRHILNSAGIERFPEKQFEMVRLGIGLYGISITGLPLQNIGTLRSTVSQVKKVKVSETIGYSRKGKITADSEIAIVPLGYADGLDRKLGNNNGSVFIHGKRVPIIGNICMDMMMLDVTGLNVKPGERVEIFGQNISVTEVAEKVGTIPYEILTGISQRVKRVYLQE